MQDSDSIYFALEWIIVSRGTLNTGRVRHYLTLSCLPPTPTTPTPAWSRTGTHLWPFDPGVKSQRGPVLGTHRTSQAPHYEGDIVFY